MKRVLCVLLCLLLLMNGCSGLFGAQETENEPMMEEYQTDFNCIGVVTNDLVSCYSERDSMQQVGTVSKGDTVKIYYRVITGEENWVFTDHGWIYGSFVQTLEENSGNCYTYRDTIARKTPSYSSQDTGEYIVGKEFLTDAITPGEGGMWCAVTEGWLPMCDVVMCDVGASGMVAMDVLYDVTQRSGPGVEYEAQGVATADGMVLITDLADVNGILWGEVEGSVWICLDFVRPCMDIKLVCSDGTIFEPTPDRDPSAYQGNQGNQNDQGSQGNQGNQDNQGDQGNQDNQGNQGNQGDQNDPDAITQTPNSTPLVGDWVRFDANEFLEFGTVSPEFWTFHADGSFGNGGCEYMYFPDQGGWNGASGGWGSDGLFTYDGSQLHIQTNGYMDPDPDVGMDTTVSHAYYSCTVNGNVATWDDTYYRSDDINDAIRDCVRSNAASRVFQGLVGTWEADGKRIEMRSDGSFTDHRGSGKYVYCNVYLCLVYDDGFIGWLRTTVGANQLTGSYWSYEGEVSIVLDRAA